jgi:hypothetical protein
MKLTKNACLAIVAAAATASPLSVATAETVTLFGQTYDVQIFDYSQQVTWDDPVSPGFTLGIREVEGAYYAGNNRIYLCTENMNFLLIYDNFIVEAEFTTDGSGNYTGLKYIRTIAEGFQPPGNPPGWDLDPGGLTVNPTATGIGAGGKLVVGSSQERIYSYDQDAAAVNALLEYPVGSGCLNVNNGQNCSINVNPINNDLEDLTFVPVAGGEFWTVDQSGLLKVHRFSTTGQDRGFFPVSASGGYNTTGDPKGITYLPDSPNFPASFSGKGGVVIVSYDNEGPGLHAFDTSGVSIELQPLTTDGTPTGAPLMGGSVLTQVMQIESLTADPITGRLFIVNQGDLDEDNVVFVLTPTASACYPDCDSSGSLNIDDFICFQTFFAIGDPYADCDSSGSLNIDDFICFQTFFALGC